MTLTHPGKLHRRRATAMRAALEVLESRVLLSAIGLTESTVQPLVTSIQMPALAGTVDDPAATVNVALLQGETVVGTWAAQTDNLGGWSLTIPDTLADGHYDLVVTASDNGGDDSGELDAADGLIIDTENPAVTFTPGQLPAYANGASSLTGTYDDANISGIAVTLDDGLGGIHTFNATLDTDAKTWSAAVTAGLPEGSYSVSVTATDLAGNSTTQPAAGALTVDTTAPTVAIDNGLLPARTNADVELTGTYLETNISTITVTLDDGHGGVSNYTAEIDTQNQSWSALVPIAGLADGAYAVRATATDLAGNTAAVDGAGSLTVDTTAPVVSTATTLTTSGRPGLTGTVDDPTATINVQIGTHSAMATNNGDGTWTLAPGTIAALADGTYQVAVTATDPAGNSRAFTGALITIKTTGPSVTVSRLTTTDTSPALSGTINDPGAQIVVNVNGTDYNAVNNGDGTWTLAQGTLAPLAQGVYSVTVTATDAVGHVAVDGSSHELAIAGAQTVTLGAGISKLTYVDADGTTVTVTASKGNIVITLTGVSVAVSGTGSSRTATATGGVMQVDVEVTANTNTLTFKTGAQGDGLTTIHQITGAGVLGTLSAASANLTGGINMSGAIKNITLHNITADITMTGTWARSNGTSITAGVIQNSAIQAVGINTLKAALFSGSTLTSGIVNNFQAGVLENSGIQATTLKNLRDTTLFRNTNIAVTTINTAVLFNVDADNDRTSFGIQATTLKSLKLTQGSVTLTWKKNFLDGIEDFAVTT